MIKNFNIYLKESTGFNKPQLKFPTDKAAHYNYLFYIIEKAGLNPHCLFKREKGREVSFQDFCFDKCNSPILFPKNREIDIDSRQKDLYTNFIFKDSVFLLPATYDSKNDYADSIEKRVSFVNKMTALLKQGGSTKKEIEDFENKYQKHVDFGASNYSQVNDALNVIYQEFKEHYVNGKLRVYTPESWDHEGYGDYDYPHKYIKGGRLERPNGVLFLSELEKWLYDEYGLQDDKLYQFIIYNQYLEGRYWERVWDFPTKGNNKRILKKSGFGEYGMEPTKTISSILGVLQQEFEINGNNYEGLPVFVDYYKKIAPKY